MSGKTETMALPSLFSETLSMEELEHKVKQLLQKKTTSCHVSFGFWMDRAGRMHNDALMVVTARDGKCYNASITGENFHDMINQIKIKLDTL